MGVLLNELCLNDAYSGKIVKERYMRVHDVSVAFGIDINTVCGVAICFIYTHTPFFRSFSN